MSADNWAICPRCNVDLQIKTIAFEQLVKEQYGKIPIEEWEKMKKGSKKEELQTTLREDYEMWMSDYGIFHVRYNASCEKCNYEFAFNHEQQTEVLQK